MADPLNGVQIRGSQVRCPDCGACVDLTFTLGPTKRVGNEYVVAVGFDEERFVECMTAHVKLNPDIHPSFIN